MLRMGVATNSRGYANCRGYAIKTLSLATLIFIALHLASFKPCSEDNPNSCGYGSFTPTIIHNQQSAHARSFEADLPPLSSSYVSDSLKPRRTFKSYDEYIHLQLKKTTNPKLRKLWTSTDWRRKVDVFSLVFQSLMHQDLLNPSYKVLCIAARVGQEVLALREIGVNDSIGVDLVPSPPLVVKGDMHRLPFAANTFDFEFTNAFDHSLLPAVFASEVERTLKPGGVVVLHVALRTRTDKYSANDLLSIDPLLGLFKNCDVVHVKDVDAFGLDSEVVLRKRRRNPPSSLVRSSAQLDNDEVNIQIVNGKAETAYHGVAHHVIKPSCSSPKAKRGVIEKAEPLIMEEPKKPWITLKENAKSIKYLPSITDISNYRRHIYVDVGARSYSSSIGSWFVKRYPKQNQEFSIYAIEADKSFAKEYMKHKNVHFMPYAAWVRNESLVFGADPENRAVEGEFGMGRIQTLRSEDDNSDLQTVVGIDFAAWLKRTVSKKDFVVMKMDIEGTEFDVLQRMVETGAICLVDELFLECHYNRWQRTSPERTSKYKNTYSECLSLFSSLRNNGVLVHQWW